VKLVDANILLYAYDSDSTRHAACRDWLEVVFNDEEMIALPWQTILAFVRIATNSRAVRRPLTGPDACDIVGSWLERQNVVVLDAGERFWEIFQGLMGEAQVSGPLVTDTALAALALEHGATLYSTDRDFRRFRGLKLLDPSSADIRRE
jgi:toxin-antitoxin system PIN domain toxin